MRAAGIEPASSSVSSWRSATDLRAHLRANGGTRTLTARLGRPACDRYNTFAKALRARVERATIRLTADRTTIVLPENNDRATAENRTRDFLITNQALCQLSYSSDTSSPRPESNRQPSHYECAALNRCATRANGADDGDRTRLNQLGKLTPHQAASSASFPIRFGHSIRRSSLQRSRIAPRVGQLGCPHFYRRDDRNCTCDLMRPRHALY